ncbi:type II toxin-antitoxin system HicA family toxin [Geminocystis herdmanii]|uniref:type II toxin-antitoxin system HicA family toxin n=1 Tax=Geminocystis herdmanii TaxID=669359 RepID=UPI00034AD002|nr:type II toxin-antitoxin system HicA family toxin [Geminocystis herdmanii]
MKIPRDLSNKQLIKALKKLGYKISHQTGSHIRLTTEENGEHHLTIPAHNPLKVGTLNSIFRDIGNHFHLNKNELLNKLFN